MGTTFPGCASGGGVLFDLNVKDPAGLEIQQFDSLIGTAAVVPVTLEVYLADDTYSGKDGDPTQ